MDRSRVTLCCLALVSVFAVASCRSSGPVVVEPTPTTSTTSTPTDAVRPEPAPLSQITLNFEPVADGFDQPLFLTGAGDGSGRLFVVEKGGRVWILRDQKRLADPFLDLSAKVSTESERGLLGLAFAPDFEESGELYVDYTDLGGNTVVSRMTATGDAARADSEEVLLRIVQPYANHNGGMVAFGPDGYLYIGTGDGGSGGDPEGNGQKLGALLGKLLRIDVRSRSAGTPYGVPADNPFASGTPQASTDGARRPEIWAWGLRNPWRFSFDRETGDMWIGDVGQNEWEEIDFEPASSAGGENYGWNVLEATHPYPPGASKPENGARYTAPVVEYDHGAGQSVTGGYVYRGSGEPNLFGTYLYGDFEVGRIWGLQRTADGIETRELADTKMLISSFGEDDAGELYVVDFNGSVYRVRAE
ncbi:MAG: PQQ-dependent sugar dehydrogenase [Coriobacteriia bacterium]|nr:PQQ-dependent sugar dehydrogenase [Coriobacteriia bacterium]